MRLLVDVHAQSTGTQAWDDHPQATVSYTNHTLLPEALEMWPVLLLERLLPRHMQIIYLLNARHLDTHAGARARTTACWPALSLIDEQHGRRVRMGQPRVPGQPLGERGQRAAHRPDAQDDLPASMDAALGGRIVNRTNGITFRRWLHQANPELTRLLVDDAGRARAARSDGAGGFACRLPRMPGSGTPSALQRRPRKEAVAAAGR